MADLDFYAEGRAARRRGAPRGPRGPYTPGPRMARWQAGWDAEDALLQKALLRPCDIPRAAPTEEAALLRPCDIPRTAPPAAKALDPARPKPKVVQIAVMAEGANFWPTLIALRDDGTLWTSVVTKNEANRRFGAGWVRCPLPPFDETADGR